MYDEYRPIAQAIAKHSDIFDFAPPGSGATEEQICNAEDTLGVRFPPSYRWWLSQYLGGSIGLNEVYSIYKKSGDPIAPFDVVTANQNSQKLGLHKANTIEFFSNDLDGIYYFDLSTQNQRGESPVYVTAMDTIFAIDFFDFLVKQIELYKS